MKRQQILCCDSSVKLDMLKRKASTRKTRRVVLKAFFLQQWSVSLEVRLVQMETGEVLADCATKTQSTPTGSEQICIWSKRSRGTGVWNFTSYFSTILCLVF